MGGLGGYGGGQLGPALGAATPGGYVAGQVVKGAANPLLDTTVNTALNQAGTSMMTNPLITNAANSMTQAGLGAGSGVGFMDKATQNIMSAGSGLKNIATGQPGAWDAFKAAGGTGTQLALPVGGAVLGGLEPSDIYGEPINMDEARKKQAYDPYATLNLNNDTGLRLIAKGGEIKSYALGGTVGNPSVGGGLSDLYNRPEGQALENISNDGYGIGRLNSLANAESMNTAKTLGYAMGGPVSFADGGDAMKLQNEITPDDQSMGLTSLMPPATTPPAPGQAMSTGQVQNTATALSDTASSDSSIIAQVANNLRTNPNYQPKNPIEAAIVKQIKGTDQMQQGQPSQQGLGSIAPSQPMAPSYNPSVAMGPTYFAGMNAPRGYADGGDVVAGETGMNLEELPSLNLNFSSAPSKDKNAAAQGSFMDSRGPGYMIGSNPMLRAKMGSMKANAAPTPTSYALNVNTGKQEAQYAHGGYLNGAGDGMSDSIPATIEGKQPARLADGEFVVPADVVSHIGNGSSKAGSKKLYAMMDRIRKARTGHTKQGKQINPDKYLPA
jgi:hypothetical protein